MGGVPGVEILRHGLRGQHPDIRRQMLVERQRQLCRRDAGIGMEVELEAQRVHPGIGAAAALDIGACCPARPPAHPERLAATLRPLGCT